MFLKQRFSSDLSALCMSCEVCSLECNKQVIFTLADFFLTVGTSNMLSSGCYMIYFSPYSRVTCYHVAAISFIQHVVRYIHLEFFFHSVTCVEDCIFVLIAMMVECIHSLYFGNILLKK